MAEPGLQASEESTEEQKHKVQRDLQRLGRREWWLWTSAITIMLLLTVAVVSFSFASLVQTNDYLFHLNLTQAARGLVGLVLIFNTYAIYQQWLIQKLRNRLTDQIELTTKLQVRSDEVYKLAVLDPLTGLYNRRFAEQRLAEEISRAHRYGNPLTVLLLDLNNFKELNDEHGHAMGDQVLLEFAARLKKATRGSDLAVRMGGDEFLVVLLDCQLQDIHHVLSRLSPLELRCGDKMITFTCSAGWTDYHPGESVEELLKRADHALYADKKAGKNFVGSTLVSENK